MSVVQKRDFDLAALSVNEIISFGSVILLKNGVFYFFKNELSAISIIDSGQVKAIVRQCKAVFFLCIGHWSVMYALSKTVFLFDSTAYFAVLDELRMNGVFVERGNAYAYQAVGPQDKFCGQYCILAKKLIETTNFGDVDSLLQRFLVPHDFEANMFKMQVMTVKLCVGQEFRNSDIIHFINELESL